MENFTSLFVLSLVPLFAFASEMQKPEIAVSYADSYHVVVEVNKSSNLETVLRAFCAEAKFDCEITLSAGQTKVAPMSISGTWEQVVDKLLEGTTLNYVGIPADKFGHPGKLIIEIASNAPLNETPTANMSPIVSTAPVEQTEPISPQGNESNEMQSQTQSTVTETENPPEAPAGMAFTPFAGPDGKPLMVPVQPIDSQATSRVIPFAGPDGRLLEVPVTNERPEFLPFVDEHGQRIPMPPAAPSGATPSVNPFPPTARSR